MIKATRTEEKKEKVLTSEEELKLVKQELADVKIVIDDIILNGGGI